MQKFYVLSKQREFFSCAYQNSDKLLHLIETFYVFFFESSRFLSSVTHSQKNKSVSSHNETLLFLSLLVLVIGLLKVEE